MKVTDQDQDDRISGAERPIFGQYLQFSLYFSKFLKTYVTFVFKISSTGKWKRNKEIESEISFKNLFDPSG